MSRSKSSHKWLKEHFDDQYVKKAQDEGLRSRAAFKLKEIQEKDRLIKTGMNIVDLGAAPGGWLQVAAQILKGKGRIIGLDLLEIEPMTDVDFIQGDFRESAVMAQLEELLQGDQLDLVLSDMAPNISGLGAVDQPRAMYLTELALDFALHHLKPGGDFLVKVFQGEGFDHYLRSMRAGFNKVVTRKPQASRPRSRELYLLGRGKK